MRKSILILISFLFLSIVGCQKEQTTQSIAYDKYTIQNNPDWLEVTDIDTITTNIFHEVYKGGKIAINENQYKEYFNENRKHFKPSDSIKYSKYFNYSIPQIDFNKRDLILFFINTGGGFPIHTRHLYKNNLTKQYLYLLEIKRLKVTKENSFFNEDIIIPKIESGFTFTFDTLRTGL